MWWPWILRSVEIHTQHGHTGDIGRWRTWGPQLRGVSDPWSTALASSTSGISDRSSRSALSPGLAGQCLKASLTFSPACLVLPLN